MTIERHDPAESIKVVPMVLDDGLETAPIVDATEAEWSELPKSAWLGVISLVLGVLVAITTGVAVSVASSGAFPTASVLAAVAVGLSVVTVVAGIVAIVLRRGHAEAIVGVVLGVLGNPLVLLVVLRFVGGSQ